MPFVPTEPREWLRRWGAIGGTIGVVAFLLPQPSPRRGLAGLHLDWPWDILSDKTGLSVVAEAWAPLVLGLLLLILPSVVSIGIAGMTLLFAGLLGTAVRIDAQRLGVEWELALPSVAAVVAAGYHLRARDPRHALGRWLAGLGGVALLGALVRAIGEIEDDVPMDTWEAREWTQGICAGGFGFVGACSLVTASAGMTRFGRGVARCGLVLWVRYLMAFMSESWSSLNLNPPWGYAFYAWKAGGLAIALVVAIGAGLAAVLGAFLGARQREDVGKVFS